MPAWEPYSNAVPSFFLHAVLITEDASQDARFAANPYVMGEPHIRFYAGAPLISSGGWLWHFF